MSHLVPNEPQFVLGVLTRLSIEYLNTIFVFVRRSSLGLWNRKEMKRNEGFELRFSIKGLG